MKTIEIVDYGPFEIEVGSPTYIRLQEQEKLPPGLETRLLEVDDDGQVDEGREALEGLDKAELAAHAEDLGIDPKGLTKPKLIEVIVAAGEPDAETL